jgi:hypothetical protein
MSELEARYGQELEHGENCTCCDYPLARRQRNIIESCKQKQGGLLKAKRGEKEMTISEELNAVTDAVSKANGSRRARLISMPDVARAIADAQREGLGYVVGGLVAQGYNYQAITSAVAALRHDQSVWLLVGVKDAHRSSSPVTWFGARSVSPLDLALFQRTRTTEWLQRNGWLQLSPETVEDVLARYLDDDDQQLSDEAADREEAEQGAAVAREGRYGQ